MSNLNEMLDINLDQLDGIEVNLIHMPRFTMRNQYSEIPKFGLRLSEKLKDLDNL